MPDQHKLQRFGVIHDIAPGGVGKHVIAKVTACEAEAILYPADELTRVHTGLATTCLPCLAFRFWRSSLHSR